MRFRKITVFSRDFKGLPNGWKELLPVTFVTGENSSGKTSFLELIAVLDSQKFGLSNQIIGATDKLNEWSDAISRFGDQKSLTIGYIAENSENPVGYSGKLVTFERVGDTLLATNVTLISGSKLLRIRLRGSQFLTKSFPQRSGRLTLSRVAIFAEAAHNDPETGFNLLLEVKTSSPVKSVEWLTPMLMAATGLMAEQKSFKLNPDSFDFFNGPPFRTFKYGPIRGETEKFYQTNANKSFSSDGSHFPYRFQEISKNQTGLLTAITKFGLESGLFDSIEVKKLSAQRRTSAFSVVYEKFGKEFFGSELGYGLGQVIPIAADLLITRGGATFLIQQPEVHLHPRAQAAFGTLLANVANNEGFLIVETHSDYLIDRFRLEVSKSSNSVPAQILFFEVADAGSRPTSSAIKILSDGKLLGAPASYREFFLSESIDVFENL